jgi:hypothetical protein
LSSSYDGSKAVANVSAYYCFCRCFNQIDLQAFFRTPILSLMIANKKYATDSNLAKKRRAFFHDATGLLDDILGQLLCTRSLRSDRSGCKARMLELLPLVASSRCENVLDKIIGSGSELVPSLCFFCIRNGSFLGCCYLCYACRDHQLPLLATKIHFALFHG